MHPISATLSDLASAYSPTPLVSTPSQANPNGGQQHVHRAAKVTIPLHPPPVNFSEVLRHRFLEEMYDIGTKISEGTYGEVHVGTHRVSGDKVALKRLKRLRGLDGFPLNSLREVTALKHVEGQRVKYRRCVSNSTNTDAEEDPLVGIIRLREVLISSSHGHDIFLVFDFVDHSVSGLLRGGALGCCLSLNDIAYVFRQLVLAVSQLHCMGIVHRDIKADNLLVSSEGDVRLADFGLCVFLGASRGSEGRDLTPSMINLHYRPPEMLLGEKYGKMVDIWSVGCFLAQVFLGYPPFVDHTSSPAAKPGGGSTVSAESELEQLSRICEVLGPLPQIHDLLQGGRGGGAARYRRANALSELHRQYQSRQAGGGTRDEGPVRGSSSRFDALFAPSKLYLKYRGFRCWFLHAVEERQQRYAREALTNPSIVIPPRPSPSCVDSLCQIFKIVHDARPTAEKLLTLPFFTYADAMSSGPLSPSSYRGSKAAEKLAVVEAQLKRELRAKLSQLPQKVKEERR